MGIRTLHSRTAHAWPTAQAGADAAPGTPPPPVPAFAAGASTARIPTAPATVVRRTAADLGRRLTGRLSRAGKATVWRSWADLGRGYLALLSARLPRTRPAHTMTVFVATLTERPTGSAGHRPLRDRWKPGPGATS
ncbi:hypothetical protein [Streptomyces sp. NPDC051636]|uniref:hypothetical protein n=1 Tax=Streptomyces sp. NPDC051636 TaxID=3365663 RepID=UPI0037A97086